MAQKCVHKGCGKVFSNPDEECVYHPGPPVFHEGQKGIGYYTVPRCCKPRVLTFDEFMTIPPCTTGKHSAVDDTPVEEPKPTEQEVEARIAAQKPKEGNGAPPAIARNPVTAQPPRPAASPAPPEDDDDEPGVEVKEGATCKRRGCGVSYTGGDRAGEQCIHHPGQALFHEGSKGVLEFDEFMKIPGCKTKDRHLFVGKKKDPDAEEKVLEVRNDFYQTATTVIASLYLKKVDKVRSTVTFDNANTISLDLHTTDKKNYKTTMTTYAPIKPEESSFKVMGTKVELSISKADGTGWPVLRADDPLTGEIIQAGRAGRV
ncbi:chord-domain-containing protein [Teratosphaeria destructans]|uniref:Chord-domain-containing protein n=1 Tax=Teratosphaeria destructans TaxID=418781 RepID=A0A9W7T1I1_9PEZI|nr:chord-domain-containing protein [Teratosphaeria destructans]